MTTIMKTLKLSGVSSDTCKSGAWIRRLSVGLVSIVTGYCLISLNGLASAGQSPIKEMSDTVEALCPKLAALGTAGQLNAAQTDVWLRCREVKIQDGESFDDLTDEDREALSNMTSTQSSSMSRATVEFSSAQTTTVVSRLQSLRSGGATGGLALQINTDTEPEPLLFAGPVTSLSSGDTSSVSNSNYSFGRLGLFINGSMDTGERDQTINEPGFDFDGYNFTAGVDYRFTKNLVLGTAFGYAHSEADINNNGGDVESDGYGASLYGTYYVGQMYVDVVGVYGVKDYTVARNVNYSIPEIGGGGTTTVDQSFEGDPDAEEYGISGGLGYNLYRGGFNFQPYARLHYLKTEIDGYRERLSSPANTNAGFGLALDVEDQSVTSLVSALGGQISYTINTGIGVFIPQVNLDWQHEYENDARAIRASFVNGLDDSDNLILIPTDDPDRDYFGLGVGCSAVFPYGMSGFAYYDTILDLDDVTSHRVTLGLRFEI